MSNIPAVHRIHHNISVNFITMMMMMMIKYCFVPAIVLYLFHWISISSPGPAREHTVSPDGLGPSTRGVQSADWTDGADGSLHHPIRMSDADTWASSARAGPEDEAGRDTGVGDVNVCVFDEVKYNNVGD